MTRDRHLVLSLVAGAGLLLGCSGSTTKDMYFGMDAGSGFEPPIAEAVIDTAGDGTDAADGTAGAGGEAAGAGGDAGAGAGGAGGAAGAAGASTDAAADAVSDGG